MDVHSDALNTLEDQIVKTRKEDEVLEAFTERAISRKRRRES